VRPPHESNPLSTRIPAASIGEYQPTADHGPPTNLSYG
jgi:hypothetical protein